MLIFLKESPDGADAAAPGTGSDVPKAAPRATTGTVSRNIWLTLTNPLLWFLAVSLGLLNACRYGFLDWGLTHLIETQGGSIGKTALKYMVLPLGGIAGAFLSGWATDRWFGGRAAPAIVILLLSLGVLTLIYSKVVVAGSSVSAGRVASLADWLSVFTAPKCCWSEQRRWIWHGAEPRPGPWGS